MVEKEEKELDFVLKLAKKVIGEHDIKLSEIENIPLSKFPQEFQKTVESRDMDDLGDIEPDDVRNLIIDTTAQAIKDKLRDRLEDVPYKVIPAGSTVYRIQCTGYDSATFYGSGCDGRYNHHRGQTKIMYAAEKPDTCLAELTERVDPEKGNGPHSRATEISSDFFEEQDIGELKCQRNLELVDISVMGTRLKLSGDLIDTHNYRNTQAVVAACEDLELTADGFAYTGVHYQNGSAYALKENINSPQLEMMSLTKLSDYQVDASLLPVSKFTRSRSSVSMVEVMERVLGGNVIPSE